LVLQFHDVDDCGDGLRLHPQCRHLVLCLIDRRLGDGNTGAGHADQKRDVCRPDGGQRHDPSRLADSQQPNLPPVDILARLQVLDTRNDVAREILERRRLPVARRTAHPAFVIREHRHPVAYQSPGKGKDLPAIGRPRAVNEHDSRVPLACGGRRDQSSCQPEVAIQEVNVFVLLNLDTPGRAAVSAFA
jgi:hypothetical protein